MATKKNATQTAEQTTENKVIPMPTKKADPKPAKPTKAPKPAKPEVSQLDKVIDSQRNPTMWQYARLAKFAVARMEAGQSADEAIRDVMEQTALIIQGIVEQNPASAKDSDVDTATKAFFFLYSPKSTSRERGPKASGEGETEGTTGK